VKTVLISGASGLIGGRVAARLASHGWTVVGTGRRPDPPAHCDAWYVSPLGTSWSEIFRQHAVDAVVHCAYDSRPQEAGSGERGTTQWMKESAAAGVGRQVFLSSISARAATRSAYGQEKYRLESMMSEIGGLVLRPGLVIGPGGLFGRMVRLVERLPLIPMIAGGNNRVYFTGIDALCQIIEDRLAVGPAVGAWNVQQATPTSMRALLRAISAGLGVRRVFVPIPYALSLAAARALGKGPLARLGISYDNVVGAKENDVRDLHSDYAALGGPSEELVTLVERALHDRAPTGKRPETSG
jgi:nucleoside-diphosphate-sugar epimerase